MCPIDDHLAMWPYMTNKMLKQRQPSSTAIRPGVVPVFNITNTRGL
jgi:hypothetical protein